MKKTPLKRQKIQVTPPYVKKEILIGATVRDLRMARMLTGARLCELAGGLDPRTLTAIEKGRIRNPSIPVLEGIAKGLGVMVSDLFKHAEIKADEYLYVGSQKGAYQIQFSDSPARIISFTPLVKDFFCGKLILGGKGSFNQALLQHAVPIYISALVGRLEIKIENKMILLKEGENLFFHGGLNYTVSNKLNRESVLMLVTAPSFLCGRQRD